MEYPKIQSVWKRDQENPKHFIEGAWSTIEFEALAHARIWTATEKVDGTNVRVMWSTRSRKVVFAGRTGASILPSPLVDYLHSQITPERMEELPSGTYFGEGYGSGIQKGGISYHDEQRFILFDGFCDGFWLTRTQLAFVSGRMGVPLVPVIETDISLYEAIDLTRYEDNESLLRENKREGLVLRTDPVLFDGMCQRIITKVKVRDFA